MSGGLFRWRKPMSAKPCIIVDIDGTLAEFDAEKMRDWVLGSEK